MTPPISLGPLCNVENAALRGGVPAPTPGPTAGW